MAKTTAISSTDRDVSVPRPARAGGVLVRLMAKERPLVMGVLNVTPDSFSDGGRFLDPAQAIAHAHRLLAEGADILDVGAESTRPYGGAVRVPADEERNRLARVLPAVVALGVPVSIDTMKADVAAWAIKSGAAIVNDVWGLQHDAGMARVIAERGVPVIVLHNRERADPAIDIIADVTSFFAHSLDITARAGIAHRRNMVLGSRYQGLGKTPPNKASRAWRGSTRGSASSTPLLVGASRKRFISSITPSEPMEQLGGSLAAHLLAVEDGATIVRVHDVAPTVQALAVAAAISARDQRRDFRQRAGSARLPRRDATRGRGWTTFKAILFSLLTFPKPRAATR